MSFEMCDYQNPDGTSSIEPCFEMDDNERGRQLTLQEKEYGESELEICTQANARKIKAAEEIKDRKKDKLDLVALGTITEQLDKLGLVALDTIIEQLGSECKKDYERGIEIDRND